MSYQENYLTEEFRAPSSYTLYSPNIIADFNSSFYVNSQFSPARKLIQRQAISTKQSIPRCSDCQLNLSPIAWLPIIEQSRRKIAGRLIHAISFDIWNFERTRRKKIKRWISWLVWNKIQQDGFATYVDSNVGEALKGKSRDSWSTNSLEERSVLTTRLIGNFQGSRC